MADPIYGIYHDTFRDVYGFRRSADSAQRAAIGFARGDPHRKRRVFPAPDIYDWRQTNPDRWTLWAEVACDPGLHALGWSVRAVPVHGAQPDAADSEPVTLYAVREGVVNLRWGYLSWHALLADARADALGRQMDALDADVRMVGGQPREGAARGKFGLCPPTRWAPNALRPERAEHVLWLKGRDPRGGYTRSRTGWHPSYWYVQEIEVNP